jgi:hypothetical protein
MINYKRAELEFGNPLRVSAQPVKFTYRNFKVAEKVGTPFRVYHF